MTSTQGFIFLTLHMLTLVGCFYGFMWEAKKIQSKIDQDKNVKQ